MSCLAASARRVATVHSCDRPGYWNRASPEVRYRQLVIQRSPLDAPSMARPRSLHSMAWPNRPVSWCACASCAWRQIEPDPVMACDHRLPRDLAGRERLRAGSRETQRQVQVEVAARLGEQLAKLAGQPDRLPDSGGRGFHVALQRGKQAVDPERPGPLRDCGATRLSALPSQFMPSLSRPDICQ